MKVKKRFCPQRRPAIDRQGFKPMESAEEAHRSKWAEGMGMAKILAGNLSCVHALAMMCLQSERYCAEADFRDAVDGVLAITKRQQPPIRGKRQAGMS